MPRHRSAQKAAGVIRSGIQEALNELRYVVTALCGNSDDHDSRTPQPTAADLWLRYNQSDGNMLTVTRCSLSPARRGADLDVA
jgi:hypothetical protein